MLFNKSQTRQPDELPEAEARQPLAELINMQLSSERMFALGLLGIIVLLVFFLLILPLMNMGAAYSERKDDLAFRLQRYKRTIASKDAIFKHAEQIKRQYNAQGYLRTDDTASLASANLQTFIKNAIAKAGGQLTSTQSLPSKNEAVFNRISVKVRMTASIDELRSVLHEIENSKPIITLEQLDIRPVRSKRNRRTRKLEPTNKLNINFQAASFMRRKT